MPVQKVMIGVDPEVHKAVKRIAEANRRGIGDQVAVWAGLVCQHPMKQREYMTFNVSYPEDMNETTSVKGYRCGVCKNIVILPALNEA